MTEERQTLLMIRGVIAELPPAHAAEILKISETLRELVRTKKDHASMALALVGAEMAAGEFGE